MSATIKSICLIKFLKMQMVTLSWYIIFLSHVIDNTANQKARNLLHIPRYAMGSIPQINPGLPCNILYKGFYTFNEQYLFIDYIFF